MSRLPAFQAVLAGEHAAVYAYGVVGAQLSGTLDETAARQAYNLHLSRRDHVTAVLVQGGATPVAAEAGYDLGGPVTSHSAARALAAQVEAGTAGPYADLVAATDAAERDAATAWLVDAAVRSVRWGGEPTPFPGLTERSPSATSSPSASATSSPSASATTSASASG